MNIGKCEIQGVVRPNLEQELISLCATLGELSAVVDGLESSVINFDTSSGCCTPPKPRSILIQDAIRDCNEHLSALTMRVEKVSTIIIEQLGSLKLKQQ